MAGKPWTDQDIATLRTRRAAGDSEAQIGRRLGRSKGSVGAKIDRLDLPLPEGKSPALHPPRDLGPKRAKPLRPGAKTLPSLA
jgi:hypothetical protein